MKTRQVSILLIASVAFVSIIGCNPGSQSKKKHSPKYDSLLLLKPTIGWKKNLKEGFGPYTSRDIKKSDELLDKYLAQLEAAKDITAIWKAVEEVVTGFDRINVESDFIETVEREELAEFIQHAAEIYGLKYNGDITEQWRMEW